MKTSLPPCLPPSSSVTWHTSYTVAPSWGTVSLSRQPVQPLPQPAPGYHLQVLLRLWASQ